MYNPWGVYKKGNAITYKGKLINYPNGECD